MNSIPKGYKKTEVGIIPEDWKFCYILDKKNLNEASIQTGPFGTLLKASEYTSNGIPVISVREIRDGYIFIFEETPCVGRHTCKRLPRFRLEEGDIVFARKGGVDRSAIIQKKYGALFLGSDGIRLRFKKENPEYIAFWFHSDFLKKELLQNATGTIMANMSQEIMSHLPLLLPSLPEQKAIAEVLSDMDALIEAQKELIAKKWDIKQGTMQELLSGRVRLPGYETKGWKHTDIGDIPDDWEVKELKGVGVFSKGKGISRSEVTEQGKPCLRYGEIYTIYDTVVHALQSFIPDELTSTSRRLSHGDIIFAASGETSDEIAKNITYVGIEEAYVGGDTIILTPKEQDSIFLSYLLNSHPIVKQKSKIGQGDAVVHIHISKLERVIICVPSLPEQKTIAEVLSDMDDEIENLEAELEKLNYMKRGMMQELLTGRIRLV